MASATTASYHVQADEESNALVVEPCSSSAEEVWQSPSRRRALIGGAVGVIAAAALAACAVVTGTRPHAVAARELLQSGETVDVLTTNVMALDQRDPSEWQAVHAAVDSAACKISGEVQRDSPEAYARLGSIALSTDQQKAVLRQLRSVGDLRVRSIAHDIMDAIKETVHENGDKQALKRRLVEKLGPRMAEVRELRDMYFPEHIGGPADQAPALEARHLDNMPVVQHFDEWRASFAADSAAIRKLQATTTMESGFMGKMMEHYRNMMTNFEEMFGKFNPFGSETSVEYSNGASSLMTCITTAMAEPTSDVGTCFSALMASFSRTALR